METITIYNYNHYEEITKEDLLDLKSAGYLIRYSDYEDCYINCNTSDYGYYDGGLITQAEIDYQGLKYCEDTEDYQDAGDAIYLEDKDYYVSLNYSYYWECDECHRCYSDDTERHERDNYYYCEDCWEDNKPTIYGYHDYSEGYRERRYSPRDQPLYLGFELEVDNVTIDNEDLARRVLDGSPDGVLHCEYDASVAFEFISQPCTLEYHKHQYYQDWLFSELDGYCESHDAGTCGLHVHVNKDFFTEKGYERLKTILFFFKEELFRFSRRQSWNYEYSDFEEHSAKCDVTITGSKNCRKSGHYTWFNENSGCTHEFRFFRGTLRYETFMATLELVHNICVMAMSDQDVITWYDLIVPGDYCQEYSDSRDIECDAVLKFSILEEKEKKQLKELKEYLDKYAFMIESKVIFAEIIDGYIYTYTPYMLDTGKVTRKAFSRMRIDSLTLDIMGKNGFSELCDRKQLSALLGGAF